MQISGGGGFFEHGIHVHRHARRSQKNISTLVFELKKSDLSHLWSLAKNVMIFVQIILCLMSTSISTERSFSVLDRVKTKLQSYMGYERMSNLAILTTYPDMVENVDVIALRKKFACETSCTSRRIKLFGNLHILILNQKKSRKSKATT